MKERPILFSAPMVRAILEGRKTQTRRIVKGGIRPAFGMYSFPAKGGGYWLYPNAINEILAECPYGKPGDRLWVREAFWLEEFKGRMFRQVGPSSFHDPQLSDMRHVMTAYRADWKDEKPQGRERWKPAIHMPRAVSRITLEITEVRVQRLHEISHNDALAEGAAFCDAGYRHLESGRVYDSPIASFRDLWERINGEQSFMNNPWIWALTFKRVQP